MMAESKAGGGKLALTRWRAGKSDEVMLNLRVLGSYGATAPFECDKSKLVLDQALLNSFPEGYRHLVYIQAKNGASITPNLATARGPELERLYELGRQWLDGK